MTSSPKETRLDEIVGSKPIEGAKFDPVGRVDASIPLESVPEPDPETKGKAPKGDKA
jgi:hypothetical protein